MKRWNDDCVGRKVLKMMLPGERKRGRPKSRYLDVVKDDMQVVGAREEEMFARSV